MKKSILVSLLTLIISLPLMAEKSLIGRWQSEPMSMRNEKVVEVMHFMDENILELIFITDNTVPEVGEMVARLTVEGTYQFYGPMFFVKLDLSSFKAKVDKLELSEDHIKSLPSGMGIGTKQEILAKLDDVNLPTALLRSNNLSDM